MIMDPVESALQAASQKRPAPADLHDSIMRRVREAAASGPPPLNLARNTWKTPGALFAALLIVTALCVTLIRTGERTSSTQGASLTVELGSTTPTTPEQAAQVLIAPLARELDHANHDLKNAIQFVLASVP